jgi:DNA repair photolyase
MMHLTVNEVLCKSVLNKSGIEGVDYSFNPYIGCAHGCARDNTRTF